MENLWQQSSLRIGCHQKLQRSGVRRPSTLLTFESSPNRRLFAIHLFAFASQVPFWNWYPQSRIESCQRQRRRFPSKRHLRHANARSREIGTFFATKNAGVEVTGSKVGKIQGTATNNFLSLSHDCFAIKITRVLFGQKMCFRCKDCFSCLNPC